MILPRVRVAIALVAMLCTHAAADPPSDEVMIKIRELYAAGDFAGVRRELLAAYEATQHPALLFALGQAEFNLKNWPAAIDYYEKFIATNPPEEQIALAQQGIGAARIEMQRPAPSPVEPPPLVSPPPRVREWYASDTYWMIASGGAVVLGASAFAYGRHLGNDHGGSLADYDERTDRADLLQWSGGVLAGAGLIAAGITLVRWRLRPHDEEVIITAKGRGVSVLWAW